MNSIDVLRVMSVLRPASAARVRAVHRQIVAAGSDPDDAVQARLLDLARIGLSDGSYAELVRLLESGTPREGPRDARHGAGAGPPDARDVPGGEAVLGGPGAGDGPEGGCGRGD